MKPSVLILLSFSLLFSGCIYRLTLKSDDGEKFTGRYRFSRGDGGLMQVTGPGGELLEGGFARVARAAFIAGYEKTFGSGTVAVDGPEVSFPGNTLGSLFGNPTALRDAAYGKALQDGAEGSGKLVGGPLIYWMGSLAGNRGTSMACYIIGSSRSGHGLGRCKSHTGKEYGLEF